MFISCFILLYFIIIQVCHQAIPVFSLSKSSSWKPIPWPSTLQSSKPWYIKYIGIYSHLNAIHAYFHAGYSLIFLQNSRWSRSHASWTDPSPSRSAWRQITLQVRHPKYGMDHEKNHRKTIGKCWCHRDFMVVLRDSHVDYPLVMTHIANSGKMSMLSMGKLTIPTGPFSIAMLNYQRVTMEK